MSAPAVAYRIGDRIYLNITNRCSADCVFCIAKFTDTFRGYNLRLAHEPSLGEILKELELAFQEGPASEVVFVGFGEPTLRLPEVLGVIEWLKLRRIPSRLDTNGHGQLINPDRDVVAELAAAGLGVASVSLVAHNSEVYNQICRPIFSKAYRAMLKFAEDCIAAGIRVILSVVELPEVDIEACRSIAGRMGAEFRVRPLLTPASEEVRS